MLNPQGKIRFFTLELAKVMYMNCQKTFGSDIGLLNTCKTVIDILTKVSQTEDNGILMNYLNDVEDNLRQIMTKVFQYVFSKNVPTKLSYFSGISMKINQGSSINFECIAFRKILLEIIVIANCFAYLRTKDQDFIKIFDHLHNITLSSDPKDKSDRYGNMYLAKVASLLFLATPENAMEIKQQVFNILKIVV